MDVKAVVAGLKNAESIARTAARIIESCGYGDYQLADEEAAQLARELNAPG